ncbi:MAG: hypothetical protein ABIJ74_00595 [archaeon]
MQKDQLKRNSKSLVSGKILVVFVVGLILGVLIQFFLIQPLMDNSDSFKTKYAACESSREICDKEVKTFFSCMQKEGLDPNSCT